VGLQTDRVNIPFRDALMHQGRNLRPIAFDLVFGEAAIDVQSSVPFDADQFAVFVLLHDDRLHDTAVRKDRVFELLGSCYTLRVVASGDVKRERDLFVGRFALIVLQEAPDARIR
jgi:hypothetical protein